MVQVPVLREQKKKVIELLKRREPEEGVLEAVHEAIRLDDRRKSNQAELDQALFHINTLSKEIGELYKNGKGDEAEPLKEKVSKHKERSKKLEERQRKIEEKLEETLLDIPNIPHETVPAGASEEDNEVYKDWEGKAVDIPDEAQPHWELAKRYNLIDLELGAKITGSGFPLYRGKGAKLQRALISFFLDRALEAGYEEILPPYLVNATTARGTGQLPDKEGQMYHIEKDEMYLIPTAEVPITNIYRNEIIDTGDLPIKMTGYTPCFRREAGSYGADVKGLNRVHQFDKVEIVQIDHPDRSYETLEKMMEHVETILESLELPFRILRLCGGDLGFAAALTYDFEVYAAAQDKWLEVSSVSNFETFQSNRMHMRYRDEHGNTQLVHTLNGSAMALARIVAALLENNQTDEGIVIPEILQPYTGFDIIE